MRMKKIYIYQGDENRAKIEEDLKEDIFFADVYKRAEEILKELLEESKEYKRVTEKVDCENTQYQRMGNNIIAFCAARGQGKTSAMKSFAKYLSNGYGVNNKILDGRVPVENAFVVLDSVDPAALDSGESLIRVVISRIFYLLEKKCGENHNFFRNNQEKNRLLELFQECYGGIDYLRGKKQRDDSQDDLERLAALGNSARLKMNLIELIDLFLRIYTGNGTQAREADQKNRFLVVPIDDVDICTADIYGCCEEIRNYLTLPNVIVLLAADYVQLHRVILQKYMQINRGLVEYESKFKEECNRQASGYLLKLLPNNHVIKLPEYVSISENVWKELKLVYYRKQERLPANEHSAYSAPLNMSQDGYVDIFEEDSSVCDNLQQQIIKFIYDRTGMILWDDEGRFSKFIPQTMRELTQLIKKMSRGSKIDYQKLYLLDSGGNPMPDEEQAIALLNNIFLFKSFFLDNWCMNNMTPVQYIELKAWIDTLEKRKRSGRFSYKLDDMLEKRDVAQGMESSETEGTDDEMPPRGIPSYYIAMYLTIFLNEWFAEALLDGGHYKKIVDFLDGKNSLLQCPKECNPDNKHNVFYFQIADKFFDIDSFKSNFLVHFCRENEDTQYFDFFSPWRNILLNGFAVEPDSADEEGNKTSEANGNANGSDMEGNRDMRLPLKTIISNCGIYCHIKEKIKRDFFAISNKPDWRQIIALLFEKDTWLSHLQFLQLVMHDIKMLSQHYLSVESSWYLAFLMNPKNLDWYIDEYMKVNNRINDDKDIKDEDLSSVLSDWENSYSTKFAEIIKTISLEDCADNSRLKELVLAQQAVELKQNEIDELLRNKIRTEADIKKARKLIADVRAEYQRALKELGERPENGPLSGRTKNMKPDKKESAKQRETPVTEEGSDREEINKEEADNGQAEQEQ